MDLSCALVIGGESMENQFLAILQNPDILIGTPGRILHVVTEMSLNLRNVDTIIIDEADRLYEMGFLDDLKKIMQLTAKEHQTMLVSATIPKTLINFSSLQMRAPEFIRLDIDIKLSEKLKLCNIYVKNEQKIGTVYHHKYIKLL
ncbi:hypothetical protein MXB_2147 [Myxobolus squamalis]|nr:hypothetical protein MXB_2147 [Myxobolus squamalis]